MKQHYIPASESICTVEYHRSRSGKTIPVKGSMLIGDGDAEEGGRPFAFYLPPEQDLDIGLVKFFVSTRYVDLSWIAQDSPFEGGYPYGGANRQVPPRMVLANDGWDTTIITILQRQPSAQM